MNSSRNKTISILVAITAIIIIAVGVYSFSGSEPTAPVLSTSDGTITFYKPDDFGLAVTPVQVLVRSYIPPCDEDFNYCLYYNGADYEGTNFESAGIRIKKRPDLVTEMACLNTPLAWYDTSAKPDKTYSDEGYAVSVFKNIGDAGAGHSARGALYRLFVRENLSCYEFETRVGQAQFQNYPAGTIKEFTTTDKDNVDVRLVKILSEITLPSGKNNLFSNAI